MSDQPSINDLIADLSKCNEQLSEINVEVARYKKQREVLQAKIFAAMDEAGLTTAGNGAYKVSINEEVVPKVDPEHWEDVYNYLFENGMTSMLYRRLLANVWQEAKEAGEDIPHVTTTSVKKLSIRKS